MGETPPANTSKYRACGLRIFSKKLETVPPLLQKAYRQQGNKVFGSASGGMLSQIYGDKSHSKYQEAHRQQGNEVSGSASGGMPSKIYGDKSQLKHQRDIADITKSFSELDGEAAPKGGRECVLVAEKSLVRSGSEGSEAVPIPAKPLLTFGGCHE